MLTLKERMGIGAIAIIVMGLCYSFAGFLGSYAVNLNLMTDLDKLIPFVSGFVWPYLSYLFLVPLSFIWAEDRKLFIDISSAMMLAVFIASVIYCIFPAAYPRPDIICNTVETCAVWIVYEVDPAINTFPSLHVAISWIIALFFKQHDKKFGIIFVAWALVIAASTLLIKQHYILDVFFGIILARFCNWAVLTGHNVIVFMRRIYVDR